MKNTQTRPYVAYLAMLMALTTGGHILAFDSTWTLASGIGSAFDDTTYLIPLSDTTYLIPLSDDDAVGGVITINTAASYYLKDDITSRIVINQNNVCLNMNCRSATRDATTNHIITVNSGKQNIKIHDGALYNSGSLSTGCGILIESGASRVLIQNVTISDCGNGMKLNGSDGSEVIQCEIIALDLIGNTTAVVLNHADRNRFEDCCATKNGQAGFELLHSELNCFDSCKALTTLAGTTVAGFTSTSGNGNLFQNCVVKDTKTIAWEFCNKSYGFLLTGTEEKTKIIDCIVNETDVTSTVSAVAYGIHLNPVLLEIDDLLNEVASNSAPSGFGTASAWSPVDRYVAVIEFPSPTLWVFDFDGSNLSIIASINVAEASDPALAWSPNGKWIIVNASANLLTYSFDGATLTLIDTSATGGSSSLSIAWSPSGKYVATGDSDDTVRVFSFDGSTFTFIDDDTSPTADVRSVAWSPDGNYIVGGGQDNFVRVFSFDGATLTQVDSSSAGATVLSVAWSPNGKYIASGDNSDKVQVFGFDGSSLALIDDDTTPANDVNSVAWSPNGKYIVSGDGDSKILLFSFDGSALTNIDASSIPTGSVNSVSWSPSGKYISAGQNSIIRIFSAMFGPENCLIKGNIICDTAAFGQFVGTGITAGGNNCVIENCTYNNEVNYSYGIPHVYYADQNNTIKPFDNASTPPF